MGFAMLNYHLLTIHYLTIGYYSDRLKIVFLEGKNQILLRYPLGEIGKQKFEAIALLFRLLKSRAVSGWKNLPQILLKISFLSQN